MTDPTTRRTRSGRALTDEDLETLATEVAEKDYDVGVLKKRRRGQWRPSQSWLSAARGHRDRRRGRC